MNYNDKLNVIIYSEQLLIHRTQLTTSNPHDRPLQLRSKLSWTIMIDWPKLTR